MVQFLVSLLDLVKAAVWPGFLLFLIIRYGSTVGAYFHTIIHELLPRLREAGATGFKFDSVGAAGRQIPLLPPSQLKEFAGEMRTVAMREIETSIHSNITELVNSGKIKEDDKFDYIVNQLALTRLTSHFENVYRLIFGSQLKGIENLRIHSKATIENARSLFDEAKNSNEEFYENYEFNSWIGFLTDAFLIKITEDEISLTPIGEDFLKFVFDRKLSLDKRG